MDWFLDDNGLRHKRVKSFYSCFHSPFINFTLKDPESWLISNDIIVVKVREAEVLLFSLRIFLFVVYFSVLIVTIFTETQQEFFVKIWREACEILLVLRDHLQILLLILSESKQIN